MKPIIFSIPFAIKVGHTFKSCLRSTLQNNKEWRPKQAYEEDQSKE